MSRSPASRLLAPRTPRALAAALLALLPFGGAALHAEELLGSERALLYRGRAVLEQRVAGGDGAESVFPLEVAILTGRRPEDGAIVVRHSAGEDGFVAFDLVRLDADGVATELARTPPELEAPARLAFAYAPLPFPTFDAAEGEAETRAVVEPLSVYSVETDLTVERSTADSRLEIGRSRRGDPAKFTLQGAPARLEGWTEEYTFDLAAGALRAAERYAKVVAEFEGTEITLVHAVDLEVAPAALPAAGPEAAELYDAVRAIDASFRAVAGSETIERAIEALRGSSEAAGVGAIAAALDRRLEAYRQTYEATPAARAFAKVFQSEAPEFRLEDLDGEERSFRELTRGKVAILCFWAVGCGPCRMEAPHLSELTRELGGDDFTVIAVNGWDEPRDTVSRFVESAKLAQTVLLQGGELADETFGVTTYPTNFLIDHRGVVRARTVGFTPDLIEREKPHIRALIEAKRRDPERATRATAPESSSGEEDAEDAEDAAPEATDAAPEATDAGDASPR